MVISVKEEKFVVQIVVGEHYYIVDKTFFTSKLLGNSAHRFFHETQSRAVARIMRKVSKQTHHKKELVVRRLHALGVPVYCITWFVPQDGSFELSGTLKRLSVASKDLDPEKVKILDKALKLAQIEKLRGAEALAA